MNYHKESMNYNEGDMNYIRDNIYDESMHEGKSHAWMLLYVKPSHTESRPS